MQKVAGAVAVLAVGAALAVAIAALSLVQGSQEQLDALETRVAALRVAVEAVSTGCEYGGGARAGAGGGGRAAAGNHFYSGTDL